MSLWSAKRFALGGLVAVGPLLGRDLSGLLERSPFGAAETKNTAEEAPVAVQLELRGIVGGANGPLLNVFDAQTRKSYWVRPGDTLNGARIARYSARDGALLVEVGDRSLALSLKEGSLAVLGRGPERRTGGRNPAKVAVVPVATALPESERRRLENVAQLVQQRRQQRAKKT